MTWALDFSGTSSALVINTETTLATDTTNGTFVAEVDTSNLALGDILEIRLYTITLAAGAYVQVWKGTYGIAPQINNHKVSPPIASDQGVRLTIKQTAGTGRTYGWKLLRI